MELPKSEALLKALLRYLREVLVTSKIPRGITLVHDPKCDWANRRQARKFCFVETGSIFRAPSTVV